MNMPLISIIMPVYNAECYLNQGILSCLNQSYQNIELILIDDGSTDKSIEIINNIIDKDKRVKLFFTPTNQGPAAARNIGLEKAQGDYITFLDSDDFIANDKLEKQLNFMLQNHLVMTHGNYAFCDLEGNQIKLVTTSKKIDYLTLLQGNQFKIITVLV
ncbi:TPA: glycosyltransferase family 2 protein, partial [Haemophilus influenzae]